MESDDFKVEVRDGFRRMEASHREIEALVRSDHDLLTKLDEQFTQIFSTYESRLEDHEKRIRFLERVAFGLLAVILVTQFVITKVMK